MLLAFVLTPLYTLYMASDVDLTEFSLREVRERVGELVEMSIRKNRVSVLVLRDDGVLTHVDPDILKDAPVESVIKALLAAEWSEDQIEEFLGHLKEES